MLRDLEDVQLYANGFDCVLGIVKPLLARDIREKIGIM